jgi:hypothetical protein
MALQHEQLVSSGKSSVSGIRFPNEMNDRIRLMFFAAF